MPGSAGAKGLEPLYQSLSGSWQFRWPSGPTFDLLTESLSEPGEFCSRARARWKGLSQRRFQVAPKPSHRLSSHEAPGAEQCCFSC